MPNEPREFVAPTDHGGSAGDPAPGPLAARLPQKQPHRVRLMSYNVLVSAPLLNPEPFGRLLEAVDPDVLLLQEWDQSDALEVQAWLNEHAPRETTWRVRKSAGRGVAIASPHPLERIGPYRVEFPESGDYPASPYFGRTVAMVAAMVHLPQGDMAVASVHLTACGGTGTLEDERRTLEAEWINGTLKKATVATRPPLILGGDLNLVGSKEPLQRLAAGLDGIDNLAVAHPRLIGSDDDFTWRNEQSEYGPGRLDWLLYTAGKLRVSREFVLDTTRLDSESVAESGLHADDTDYSDHLPLILDIEMRER